MLKCQLENWLMLVYVEAENLAATNESANRSVWNNRYRKVVLEAIAGRVHKILVCIVAVAMVSANDCGQLVLRPPWLVWNESFHLFVWSNAAVPNQSGKLGACISRRFYYIFLRCSQLSWRLHALAGIALQGIASELQTSRRSQLTNPWFKVISQSLGACTVW